MPHAELHGKISSSGSNLSENMEDLLTSDVFGRLRYLSPDLGLVPLLQTAVSFETGRSGIAVPGNVLGFSVDFWPRFCRSEPDVVIRLDTTGGPMVVMVECKYRSGKSGEDVPEDIPAPQESADQLVREFQDLKGLAANGASALIYITGHRIMPREDLERSARSAGEEGGLFRATTYWVGWHMIWDLFRREQGAPHPAGLILKDLEDLLYHKGFRPFQGWPDTPAVLPPVAAGLWYRRSSIGWAPPPALLTPGLPQWCYRRAE
jgi:hypothetical protein